MERVRAWLVDSPLPLALLRIVVPLVLVVSPELYDAGRLVSSPDRLRFVPEGLVHVASLPLGAGSVRALQLVALSSAATAMLGYYSRASMAVLTLSAGLLFSLSQRQGAVVHDMHLFWMGALLAASPCGEAWSLDAWGKPEPRPALRYGVPLFVARVLIGLVYFFPGLHKLRVSGLAWASSANVIGHMHAKWLEHGTVPSLRVDHAPVLCALGGGAVILFELSFLVLALVKRTRRVAIVLGLAFHFSTQLFFFITFTSLWVCYAALVDGAWLARLERLLRRFTKRSAAEPEAAPRVDALERPLSTVTLVVGGALILAVAVQGARGATQAWPFACYPTFAHLQGDTIPDLAIELRTTEGETRRVTGREHAGRSQAEWGRVFRISGAYGDAVDPEALRAYATSVVAGAAGDRDPAAPVRVYRVEVPTAPERWAEPTRGGALLGELTVRSPAYPAPR